MAIINQGLGFISETDCYWFGQGTHYKIYEKLGAHPKNYKGKDGYHFAVWAPHAEAVSIVGDFNCLFTPGRMSQEHWEALAKAL